MKGLKIALLLLLLAMAADVGRFFFFPRISVLRKSAPEESAMMRLRQRQWRKLGIRRKPVRIWVPYSDISPNLIKAVLISEDENFWTHDGFDLSALQKAIEADMKAGSFKFGGSTITQQLAKNLFLTPAKTPFRKIKEAILTWRLEKDLSKKRILELYLNYAQWGEGIFGAEAASRYYFAKPASALTPIEAAKLAASLPNPVRFSPNAQSRFAVRRVRTIYRLMARRDAFNEGLEKIMAEIEQQNQAGEGRKELLAVENGSGPSLASEVKRRPSIKPYAVHAIRKARSENRHVMGRAKTVSFHYKITAARHAAKKQEKLKWAKASPVHFRAKHDKKAARTARKIYPARKNSLQAMGGPAFNFPENLQPTP